MEHIFPDAAVLWMKIIGFWVKVITETVIFEEKMASVDASLPCLWQPDEQTARQLASQPNEWRKERTKGQAHSYSPSNSVG